MFEQGGRLEEAENPIDYFEHADNRVMNRQFLF